MSEEQRRRLNIVRVNDHYVPAGPSIKCGVRFPLQPYFHQIVENLGVSPDQINPNGWRQLAGIFVLFKRRFGRPPFASEVLHTHQCKMHRTPTRGWCYLAAWRNSTSVVTGLSESMKEWRDKYLIVEGDYYVVNHLPKLKRHWTSKPNKQLLARSPRFV